MSTSEPAIFERLIQPEVGDIAPETARVFLNFRFAEADHDRMAELSSKASERTLDAGILLPCPAKTNRDFASIDWH